MNKFTIIIIYADDTTLVANLIDFYFKNNTKLNIKLKKAVEIINQLKHQPPQATLLTSYYSLIFPHLNYCLLEWGHDSERIHKLQ